MAKKSMIEIRDSLGMGAIDYLEAVEKEIFNGIMAIAKKGKPNDSVKLKALQGLYNKIRPDRTKLDLDVKNSAPYDVLVRNLSENCKDEKVGG